jgi:lipoprotein NlpI
MGFSLSEPANIILGENNFTVPMVVAEAPANVESERIGGFVGWPEIWNNILVFDGAHRKITAVKTLPAEVSGWLKLKVHPATHFMLEIPQADGTANLLLVDTGSFFGAALPPAQWKAWRAAHPNAPTAALAYYTPNIGSIVSTEAWADDATFGPLTLTDVPVHEANTMEVGLAPKNYAGTFGLYALSRLKMVLDGPHGVAYVQPLPAPGPYYSAFNRAGVVDDTQNNPNGGDWTIEGPVKLDVDNLRKYSSNIVVDQADKKFFDDDFPGAIAQYTQALEIAPKNVRAIMMRGRAYQFENDFPAAVADFNRAVDALSAKSDMALRQLVLGYAADLQGNLGAAVSAYTQAINLAPDMSEAYLGRAIDQQALGNLYDALADYDHAVELEGGNYAIAQLYGEALRRWIGNPGRDLSPSINAWDDNWSKNTGRYLSGTMNEAAYLAAAETRGQVRVSQCQTYYFIGLNHMLKGDLAGARSNWEKCLATKATSLAEYRLAAAGLAQVNAMQSR